MSKEDIENIPEDILDEEESRWPWRPEKWTDPNEVAKKIEEYFMRCVDWYPYYKKNVMYEYQLESYEKRCIDWSNGVWREFESDEEWEEKKPQKPIEWEWIHKFETPTISWLALFLECDIDTIKKYKHKDEFFRPIKEAYLRVQQAYEQRLHWHNATWAIFALKNFDWKDKTETDHTTDWKPMFSKVEVIIWEK